MLAKRQMLKGKTLIKDWKKKVCVKSNANLGEALLKLDKEALRIILIVSDNGILLGTLTDGDLRRAVLKNTPLTTSVSKVMNSNPKTALNTSTKSHILEILKINKILHLPLVDRDGYVTDLVSLQDLIEDYRYENPVFLMAGGFGTRLSPLTDNCPKPMLSIGGKPILEHILYNLANAGFYRFFISTHYLGSMIKKHFGDGDKWGVKITYIDESKPLGTAGALGLLPKDEIDYPLILMNGDIITSLNFSNLLEFHNSQNSIATMCVREYEHHVPYGVIINEGSQIKSVKEKPTYQYFINAGIYLLEPALIKSIPPNLNIDMPKLIEQQINAGEKVDMFPIYENWKDVGSKRDFNDVKKMMENF